MLRLMCTLRKILCDFLFLMRHSFRRIVESVIHILLLFPSTWVCESAFSVLLEIKSKFRSQLKTPEHDLYCAITNVSPRVNDLVSEKHP